MYHPSMLHQHESPQSTAHQSVLDAKLELVRHAFPTKIDFKDWMCAQQPGQLELACDEIIRQAKETGEINEWLQPAPVLTLDKLENILEAVATVFDPANDHIMRELNQQIEFEDALAANDSSNDTAAGSLLDAGFGSGGVA